LKALVSKGMQLDLACCGTRISHTGWMKCIDAKMINGQTKSELTHQGYCATLVKKTRPCPVHPKQTFWWILWAVHWRML
jgi:hypothetical protein